MSLSAIIVSYRTGPVLLDCLAALRDADGVDEIILVDNGNPPDFVRTIDTLVAALPHAHIIRGHGNVGFATGCNLGAHAARCDVLLFVNPDVILERSAPHALAQAACAQTNLSLIGGDLRDENGLPDRGSRRARVTPWRAFVSFSGLSRFGASIPAFRDLHLHEDPIPSAITPVGAVSGALLAMKHFDFDAVGGFDEGYFLHVEDIDLCRRVEQVGGEVLFLPGPHGVHMRSSSEAPGHTIAHYKAKSFGRYFRKFATNGGERLFAECAALALAILLPLGAKP